MTSPYPFFQSPKIKLFLRSLQLNRPLAISLPAVIDVHMLQRIVQVCDTMYMGQIYKAIYLLASFSFFRLSNLVPHSIHQFDPSRHLAQGDVIMGRSSCKLLIKWSKTIQCRDKVQIIDLPYLGLSPFVLLML